MSFFIGMLIVGGVLGVVFSPFWLFEPLDKLLTRHKKFNETYANASSSHGKVAKLKWKTIKTIYKLNKQRWRYESVVSPGGSDRTSFDCLLYNTGDEWVVNNKGFYPTYKNRQGIVRVQLSLIDYLKFLWAKKFYKEKDIGAELILMTAQRDVERLQEAALKEIQEGQKLMQEVIAKQQKEKEKAEQKGITLSL